MSSKEKAILVTGGMGFIGSNLVRELKRRNHNHKIIIIDKMNYAANINNIGGLVDTSNDVIISDLNNAWNYIPLFDKYDFEYVYHLAAESHVDKSLNNAAEFFRSNVMGTQTLLDSILQSGQVPKRIINVSTDEVYGDLPLGQAFDWMTFGRDSKLNPTSPYAASKAAQDMVAKSYFNTYNMPIITTRCSNNYGPRQDKTKMIPKAISAMVNSTEFPVYNHGLNERDWLWVYDHVDGLIKAAEGGRNGYEYLFGTGKSTANMGVLKGLERAYYGEHGKLIYKSVEDRLAHDHVYRVDNLAAKVELGWQPTVNLDTGLRKTASWYINNKWCIE